MPDLNRQTDNSLHTGYTRVLYARASSMKKSVLSISLALALNIKPAVAELPVPSATFVHAGDASYLVNGATGTITQNSERAILNWQSFNVGSGNTVNFDQPSSSSIALNRIFQNDPSRILGTINANGQIYLYNQNGFIFGKGMRFNANNIVATTLNLDEDLFRENSIINAIADGQGQPAFFDTTGDNQGVITIEDDAEISAESIMMVAPEIFNEGDLTSTDGQTILAASKDIVYLAASDKDSDLRGLLVEVGTGGTVTNAGSITAERGNVTLIGYAVNQNGRIRATTSVDKNGSIRLLARDGASTFVNTENNFETNKDSIGVDEQPTAKNLALATNSGQVTLGEGSVTEVAIDNDTLTMVPDAQEQLVSKVEIVGKEVWLKKDSTIRAPSGEVSITATAMPDDPLSADDVQAGDGFAVSKTRNDSYIYMDEGSVIDVSGTDTAVLPMERNSLAVDLTATELADSPLLRDSVLRGEVVYVDLQKGTDLIDYSGTLTLVEKTVAERHATGGQIDIRSEGDFVQRDGALLDISGGKVTYADGFIKETRLVSDGRIINISDADKLRQYDAVLGSSTKTHDRWAVTETFFSNISAFNGRFVNSFVEGKSAGKVDIIAASALLSEDGIDAGTIAGPYQNGATDLADRGSLHINLKFNGTSQALTFTAETLIAPITDELAKTPDAVTLQRDNLSEGLVLADDYMKRNGIGQLSIRSNGAVVIDDTATVTADSGSSIDLMGTAVNVEGDIVSRGGDVTLSAVPRTGELRADLAVADDVVIDVSGLWVNNTELTGGPSAEYPAIIHGGDIYIEAEGDVSIGDGSILNASGGAVLDTGYDISAGEGGDISLIASNIDGGELKIDGELQSYSLSSGGTLHLETADVLVTNDEKIIAADKQLVLTQSDFESGGFSRYEVVANAGNLVIDAVLKPIMQNLVFDNSATGFASSQAGFATRNVVPSGTDIAEITSIGVLADHVRAPVDLAFTLDQVGTDSTNKLVITERAKIEVDPGADISVSSDTSIYMAGEINARSADVSMTITAPPTNETGYLDNQAIWLADGSRIDVTSSAVYEPNERDLQIGEIYDAGKVSLTAKRGFVVIEEGAVVDVSAKTETFDLLVSKNVSGPVYSKTAVAPRAGTIELSAAEGVVIDGELKAMAADSAGTEGGKFSLELDSGLREIAFDQTLPDGAVDFDFDSRDIVVTDELGRQLAVDAEFGDAIDPGLRGIAYVDVSEVLASGFDTVKLKTDHIVTGGPRSASEIRFESDVELSVDNSVILAAPTINTNDRDVYIDAAYVSLGSDSRSRNSVPTTPVKGLKDFTVDAALVDIRGDVEISGTEQIYINASDDIRFIGARTSQNTDQLTSSLTAATDINLTAGQIYPATFSNAEINVINDPDGVVEISGNGNTAPVLSALGSLSIDAPYIIQGGVLKAPLGNIELNASEKVTLLPDSVTSISAEGQSVPFGTTKSAGVNWTYKVGSELEVTLVDKSVALDAPDIDVQEGSTVDISGGGDIFAYEFVSGPTGSQDILLPENAGSAFAILPHSDSRYAPYDLLVSDGLDAVGRQVYLEAGDGLAAGFYTVLPARYALIDGAKLVTPLDGFASIFPGQTNARIDGAQIHAGKYAVANTDIIDSTYSAFVVEDGSVVRTRSEYIESSANDFFTENLPQDAGALIIQTIESLALAGNINGEHAIGTRGSRVDILAENIEVIADGSNVETADFIQLTDSGLSNLEVDSLMLGGRRRIGDGETEVSVQSSEVIIRESAELSLPEILVTANDIIEIENSARLYGSGGSISEKSDSFVLDNNAALIGVTVNALPTIQRTGTATGGSINLKSGSVLGADNSVIVSSISDVNLDGELELVDGNLSIGANEVSFGAAPVDATGLVLSTELINSLVIQQLDVSSVQSMTIYDDLALDFSNLTISAPGINAKSAAGATVEFNVRGDVVVRQNGGMAVADGLGDGVLNIDANNIIFDGSEQDFIFSGFSDVNLSADTSFTGTGGDGDNRFNFSAAELGIDTPLVTGESGSSLGLTTTGNVMLSNTSTIAADASQVYDLGAELNVVADNVLVDTNIVLPGGRVFIEAEGAGTDDHVTIASNGLIDVSGRTFDFVDGSQQGTGGGEIRLVSATADVNLETGSVIDVSSSDVAGDAGTIVLSAPNGNVNVSGDMLARHADGYNGGRIRVDVNRHADLDGFLQKIQDSGFSHSQRYRVRDGDINIPGLAGDDTNIVASDIVLVADNGAINVSGVLDASGESAGQIALYASGDIDVTNAILDAFATSDSAGGDVILATTGGALSVDATTQINVSGEVAGIGFDSGKVTLRAPRTAGNTEVAINNFEATVTGAERIDIEGVAFYNDAVISTAQQTTYSSDASSWLANETAIVNRLSLATDSRVHLLAGIDVSNAGDITITDEIDFYQWQQTDASIDEGTLTIRAGGNLDIDSNISDAVNLEILYSFGIPGFPDGPEVSAIKNGESWNYRLVSGADLGSADVMSVSSTGDLTLAQDVIIRTGKGDIDIASGGDLVLADQTSVIYTTGQGNGTGDIDFFNMNQSFIYDGAEFPDQGGDINIDVAGDIVAAVTDQFFTDWLQRAGGVTDAPVTSDGTIPGMWAVVLNDFEQGIAALGGGDIKVNAGGDVINLSLSTPTTGQITQQDPDVVTIRGGGDIHLTSGGDIRSPRILADGGKAVIKARGDIASSEGGLNTLLAVGDATVDIIADGDVVVEGIGSTTMLPLSELQNGGNVELTENKNTAYFFSYTDRSAVSLTSNTGDVVLNNDTDDIKAAPNNWILGSKSFSWVTYPGALSVTAISGDIAVNNPFTLSPDADGDLRFTAAGNIVSRAFEDDTSQVFINVSDIAVAALPSILDPVNNVTDIDSRLSPGTTNASLLHDEIAPLHGDDDQPLRITANGSIIGNGELKIRSPKKAQVVAGADIRDFSIEIQNILPTDKSIVIAGGDIKHSLPGAGSSTIDEGISVTGPGSITVIAGGDIDLGDSKGIRSRGNVENPVLPGEGADIAVFAGVNNKGLGSELDTSQFIATYFRGETSADSSQIDIDVASYQRDLVDHVLSDSFDGDLAQSVTAITGVSYADDAEAVIAFNELAAVQKVEAALASFSSSSVTEQRKLIIDVFVSELKIAANRTAVTGEDSEYARGFLAIDLLFASPLSNETIASMSGDINLPFSRILSTAGGDINVFAPNGEITVGFTAEVVNVSEESGVLGMVVAGQGDLSAVAEGNINVNLSRIQANDGGDITLWSSSGDIDAGRGAKTALTIPPPITTVNSEGQIEIQFPAAVSGSGISNGVSTPGLGAGTVTLAAPGGAVNSSDAGIGSAGDLVVAAKQVVGDSFSAGGASVGVPTQTNVTAGLTNLSSATDDAVNNASQSANAAAAEAANSNVGVALVTVELLAPENEEEF